MQITTIDVKLFYTFVSRTGVEPARGNPHYPLKVARLPISPPGHIFTDHREHKNRNALVAD